MAMSITAIADHYNVGKPGYLLSVRGTPFMIFASEQRAIEIQNFLLREV